MSALENVSPALSSSVGDFIGVRGHNNKVKEDNREPLAAVMSRQHEELPPPIVLPAAPPSLIRPFSPSSLLSILPAEMPLASDKREENSKKRMSPRVSLSACVSFIHRRFSQAKCRLAIVLSIIFTLIATVVVSVLVMWHQQQVQAASTQSVTALNVQANTQLRSRTCVFLILRYSSL